MPPFVIDMQRAEDARDVVHRAVQALAEGKLVAFPTETVYGLAASARCADAVKRVLEITRRPEDWPLTLAVKSADDALDYVPNMSPLGRRVTRRCWPGPVTVVLDATHPDSLLNYLPDAVRARVAPNGAVRLRAPAHTVLQDVQRMLVGPIVLAGVRQNIDEEAVTAAEVTSFLGDRVDLVLDDGRCRYGQPSTVVRISNGQMSMVRAGVFTESTLRRLSRVVILLVCTGNTCRSPMAEALTRKLLAERLSCGVDQVEEQGVAVLSAGLSAMFGGRAAPEAVATMAREGLDLASHVSQPLTEQLVRNADLLLAMTRAHRDAILAQWPDAGGRVHLLMQSGADVPDPIGCPAEMYERCAAQLKAGIEPWVKNLEI
jgi:protein-tyrosine phosphatase